MKKIIISVLLMLILGSLIYYQNENITLLSTGFIILLLIMMINKNKNIEFLSGDASITTEAINAMATLYNSEEGQMTLNNLHVTGNVNSNLITTPQAKIGNWNINKSSLQNTNYDGDIVANQGNYNFNYSTASTPGEQNGTLNFGSIGNSNGNSINFLNNITTPTLTTYNMNVSNSVIAPVGTSVGGWTFSSSQFSPTSSSYTLSAQNGYLSFNSNGEIGAGVGPNQQNNGYLQLYSFIEGPIAIPEHNNF